MTNSQTKERFGLAALLDIPVGIMSALSNGVGSFCSRAVCEIRLTPLLQPRPRQSSGSDRLLA